MRIRIVFGVFLSLAAAFAFVWLQFRAEAIAQDVSPKAQPADSISPFGSNQVSSEPTAELPALAEPATADAVFAEDALIAKEEPETSDAFADDTPPARPSKRPLPPVEPADSDPESYDPFSSAGAALPSEPSGPVDTFGFDSEPGSDEFGSSMKEQPLRIIRLRTVRAVEVGSLIESLFHEDANKKRWFLSTENQSNSLIFKGPAREFDQFKKLASELDRLAETPVDPRKKTVSWPVPHVIAAPSETGSQGRASQWPIRIIRLLHLHAEDFVVIAWDLARSQNSKTQLRVYYEAATNSVVVRGPAAEISQVEQLAQQLDQPAAGPARGEPSDSEFDFQAQTDMREVFDFNRDAPLEIIEEPAEQSQRMRMQIAASDQESVRLASEIRSLRRNYSSDHPKLAEARQKLEDVLKVSFQLRLQLQSLEVAVIKSRLADIESRVHQRSRLRQQIINRRLHELLGEKDDLSWEVARTRPVQPSSSLDELLPPPDGYFDPGSADIGDLIPRDNAVDENLLPPTRYADEVRNVGSTADTIVPKKPVAEFPIGVEPVSADFLKPDIDGNSEIVGRVVPVETPVTPRSQTGLNDPSRNEGATWQQDLLMAENAVETATVKVDRATSRLARMKDSDQEEDLEYELRLEELALDQARKLLEQKHRWIAAQRNSHVVNIRYLEKSLELAKSEYELMIETLKKVPGSIPTSEVRRQELQIQKAELRLKQAEADLDVFEVENRTSRTPETKSRTYQNAPAASVISEPQPTSRNRTVDDSVDKDVAVEPGTPFRDTIVPTESTKPLSPPETPTPEPEATPNPVRSL